MHTMLRHHSSQLDHGAAGLEMFSPALLMNRERNSESFLRQTGGRGHLHAVSFIRDGLYGMKYEASWNFDNFKG